MNLIKPLWVLTFLFVLFDGAIRKWIFPDLSAIVFLIKDVLVFTMVILLLLVLKANPKYLSIFRGFRRGWLPKIFFAYVFICFLNAFNPNLPSVLLGAYGVKTHVLYIGLIFIVPVLYTKYPSLLDRNVNLILIAGVFIALLGIVQFNLPAGHWMNSYANETKNITTFGEYHRVRITGTFAYISGMTTFMFAVSTLAFILLLQKSLSRMWRLAAIAAFILSIAASTMTGSRWGIYVWALVLPALLFFYKKRLLSKQFLIGIAVALSTVVLAWFTFPSAVEAFLFRAVSAGDDSRRVLTGLIGYSGYFDSAGVIGYGTGATHQAAPVIVPGTYYEWLAPLIMDNFEDEPSRVLVELGAFGFFVYVILRLTVLWYGVKVLSRSLGDRYFYFGVWSICFILLNMTTSIIFNVTAQFFYWYAVGILIFLDSRTRLTSGEIVGKYDGS